MDQAWFKTVVERQKEKEDGLTEHRNCWLDVYRATPGRRSTSWCSGDSGFCRDELMPKWLALDLERPRYLTVLASSYFRSGQLEKAPIT
jgi:hypothetical protein